jgi:hypothetical protein
MHLAPGIFWKPKHENSFQFPVPDAYCMLVTDFSSPSARLVWNGGPFSVKNRMDEREADVAGGIHPKGKDNLYLGCCNA